MTLAEALRTASQRLAAGNCPEPAKDARRLLAFAAGIAPDRLFMHLPDAMTTECTVRFEEAIQQRLAHRPVAQIVGERTFWGRQFRVTSDTLDPRPETEILIAQALQEPFSRVLDLGTGTGIILLTLMAETGAAGMAVDISEVALKVARANAQSMGLMPDLRVSDWFSNVDGTFDLIVSNPPYIAAEEMPALSPDVRLWEPHLALTPGGDGLEPYRIIARHAPRHLVAGGRLLVEIGTTQAAVVVALFQEAGLAGVAVHADFDGRDRVVSARRT
ncbi:peptide chain release factor N(5)-glutamine methyltransferase [Falsirhodobacter sp. alg1]|uniref:peptide chain release factor N(5)-glutamine methyltransferase n=1 Tax=Falsirhodobacter sp. alg1 TaxID=1472418 RepID=UPI000787A63C|nr:peptide chain release factor N(5)-glutamine methyltransferase [Falsirhodobacter sp. alg1]